MGKTGRTGKQVIRRSPGPRVLANTVRILASGEARLSSDLAEAGDRFVPAVTWKNQIPILHLLYFDEKKHGGDGVLTAYDSNLDAKSPLISLVGTLHSLGRKPVDVKGEYPVEVSKEGITIRFDRKKK